MKFAHRLFTSALVAGLVITAGCATSEGKKELRYGKTAQEAREQIAVMLPENRGKVQVVDRPFVNPVPVERQRGEWLKAIRVNLTEPESPMRVSELVRMLKAESGINFSSHLPLDSYYYNGYGLTNVDGLTALNILMGSVGLDFEVNDEHKFVTITPVTTKSWVLSLGNRKTEFSSSGSSGTGESSGSSGGGASGGGSSGGAAGGIQGISAAGAAKNETESKSVTSIEDNFWEALQRELTERLTVMVPVMRAAAPSGANGAPAVAAGGVGSDNLFREVKLGRATINANTGSITVQAPKSVLREIDAYVNRLEAGFNTSLEFEGRLLLVTTTKAKSAGLDISSFKDFAGRYGAIFTNNALGGVTVSIPNGSNGGLSAISGSPISQNILGVMRSDGLLNVFSAFLESYGEVSTIQKPFIRTTSGVPATFSQFDKTYINNITENTSTTQAGATVSRTNTLIPFEFGTSLRVAPRYDLNNEQIRALISLVQVIQSGSIEIDQYVTDGNAARPIKTSIPLDRRIEYQGETLLKDGDLIVLGGQTIKNAQANDSGYPFLKDLPGMKYVFGQTSDNELISTYYFAITVRTRKTG